MSSPRLPCAVPETERQDNLDRLRHELLFQLVRAYDCITSEQSKLCQQFDITPQQFNVLKVLAASDGEGSGVACQAIGEQLLNRVPDITRLLDRLEQAGLIVRVRCCTDRRVVRTQLTDAGRAKVASMQRPLEEAIAARFALLDDEELRTLSALLEKLRGAAACGAGGTHSALAGGAHERAPGE
jgi:DNA-binding MarR family transcriptional regulator